MLNRSRSRAARPATFKGRASSRTNKKPLNRRVVVVAATISVVETITDREVVALTFMIESHILLAKAVVVARTAAETTSTMTTTTMGRRRSKAGEISVAEAVVAETNSEMTMNSSSITGMTMPTLTRISETNTRTTDIRVREVVAVVDSIATSSKMTSIATKVVGAKVVAVIVSDEAVVISSPIMMEMKTKEAVAVVTNGTISRIAKLLALTTTGAMPPT